MKRIVVARARDSIRIVAVVAAAAFAFTVVSQAVAAPLGSRIAAVQGAASASAVRILATDAVNNDMFASAVELPGHVGGFWYEMGTNVGYSVESSEPLHAGKSGGTSGWFSWTAPSDGILTIDTFSSDFDTLLAVYAGSAVDTLTVVASNDDYDTTSSSLVSFPVTSGSEYRIALDGYGGSSGIYYLEWEFSPHNAVPVWRFYNRENGSHFYTASAAEASWVWSALDTTYDLDGPAYAVNALSPLNSSPLYRFYNKKNGSHFYTASEVEKSHVIARLGATYAYDGPAYYVCTSAAPGATTVYRFYNKKNGSHFYTASEAERSNVVATLSETYSFDGPAFQLAP